jgi:hypothetical protein
LKKEIDANIGRDRSQAPLKKAGREASSAERFDRMLVKPKTQWPSHSDPRGGSILRNYSFQQNSTFQSGLTRLPYLYPAARRNRSARARI